MQSEQHDHAAEPAQRSAQQATYSEIDGMSGKVFRVEPEQQTFQFLTETAFDPKSQEGKTRHTVHWTNATRFVRVQHQSDLQGIADEVLAHFRGLDDTEAEAVAAGRKFVVKDLVVLAQDEDGSDRKQDANNVVARFRPDPASSRHRGGAAIIAGKPVAVHLGGGNRAKVQVRRVSDADAFSRGFWEATVHGDRGADGRFMAARLEISPRVDPREIDNPALPRVLVVGDSISMNYHTAAKEALADEANYYRIDGNGGDTERGVACMDLWLGDYSQPGLQWDVIQFNHGLHDLKQAYDKETGVYGAYQVPLADYKANLHKEIAIMQQTGATLVWCSTTPVPRDNYGEWKSGTFGRRSDAVELYNQAAREVVAQYPEIRINDLYGFIQASPAFDAWRQQKDVHFWDAALQELVGQAVAEALRPNL